MESLQCEICKGEISPDEEVTGLVCGHLYRKECVDQCHAVRFREWPSMLDLVCPQCKKSANKLGVDTVGNIVDIATTGAPGDTPTVSFESRLAELDDSATQNVGGDEGDVGGGGVEVVVVDDTQVAEAPRAPADTLPDTRVPEEISGGAGAATPLVPPPPVTPSEAMLSSTISPPPAPPVAMPPPAEMQRAVHLASSQNQGTTFPNSLGRDGRDTNTIFLQFLWQFVQS